MCLSVLPPCVYVHHLCAVCAGIIRGCQSPWDQTYRWVVSHHTTSGQGTESSSSVRATNALNCWARSLTLVGMCLDGRLTSPHYGSKICCVLKEKNQKWLCFCLRMVGKCVIYRGRKVWEGKLSLCYGTEPIHTYIKHRRINGNLQTGLHDGDCLVQQ